MVQPDNKKQESPRDQEVDLGVFFTVISKSLKKIGSYISDVFNFLFSLLITLLLFIKRNLVWLVASAVLGFSIGLYKYNNTGPSYFSDMTVLANFESSRLLYQKINYFNALIKEGRNKELSEIFNIDEADAGKLNSFEIEPIDDQMQQSKLYRENFLQYKRNSIAGADTNWTKTLTYKDFVSQLTKYDYPLHNIRLYSKNPTIYPKVQQGIINLVQQNTTLQHASEANKEIQKTEEDILSGSLRGIDSLRKAYNNKIMSATVSSTGTASSIVVGQEGALQLQSPEIELYDKELILKDELIAVKKRGIDKNNVLQVYSDFNNVGTRVSKLREEFIIYSEIAILVTLIILVLISLYKYLNKIEEQAKRNEIAASSSEQP